MPTTLFRDGAAPHFEAEGVIVTGYASPSRGCASVSMWKLVLQPGARSPLHELTTDEAFVALRGSAVVILNGEEFSFSPGDGLSVPPSTPFQIRNDGADPFEAVACMTAGGKARVGEEAPFSPPWAL
jgi:mannose-6-phosphate isomerase-like protein (cupin superfamily)